MKHGINGPLWLGDFLQTRPCFVRISGHRWVMWLRERVELTPDSGEKSCSDSGSTKKFSWSWISSLFFCNTSAPEETVHHVHTSVSGALSGPCWTWAMFGTGHLVSPLSSAVFHSSGAHFFPAFPSRLTSPQIFIPGPLLSYELLRSYLQPEPCKQALLLAAQSTGQHAENIGEPILHMTS